ncbi:hypothetical protein C0J52_24650 [Blattella germanica]|nr:hypothetical protein C0J52_24650 [Blattella germanica]
MKMVSSAKYNHSKGLDSQQIEQVLDEIFVDEDSVAHGFALFRTAKVQKTGINNNQDFRSTTTC